MTHNGRRYPALYTPRNSTLIDLFSITPDEQRQLRTIIGEDEKKNRKNARNEKQRRADGRVTRDVYLTANDEKRIEARRLAEGGLSQRAIAETLGVPRTTVAGWL